MTTPRLPSPALLVSILALVVSLSGAGFAATGGTFLLGKANTATKTTKLKSSASLDKSTLEVQNKGDGPAATFRTRSGEAPFAVAQDDKVANLNADLLDGLDASSFQRADSTPQTAIVRSSFAQPSATATAVVFTPDVETFDPAGMHAAGSSSPLVALVTGTYLVSALVEWENISGGYRSVALQGPTITDQFTVTGGANDTRQNATSIVHLAAGQSMQVVGVQGSGVAVDVQLLGFAMTYVGP